MSSRLTTGLAAVVATLAVASGGCGDFQRGAPLPPTASPTPTPGGNGGGAVSFGADAHSVLLEYCESCHQASGDAGNTGLVLTGEAEADYPATLEFVDPENPPASRLLTKARGLGHTGGSVISGGSDPYQTLLDWIAQGANP